MLSSKEIRILSLLTIDTAFFLLELIIGYAVHSLALIADSFHMLNDIVSLIVALWAVSVAKNRNPDSKYTYGWRRAEILGALVNAVFLMALCSSIFLEAVQRFFEPQEITNPKLVLYVGTAGLISNIVGLFLFHDHGHSHSHGGLGEMESQSHSHSVHTHGHAHAEEEENDTGDIQEFLPASIVERYSTAPPTSSENTPLVGGKACPTQSSDDSKTVHQPTKSLNMHGVFLHVVGDALGNVGVMLTAIFIWKTDYSWRFYSDPFISLVITCIIFSSALPLSRKASRILLQATPSTISADEVKAQILKIPGVISIHDFHIWNLNEYFFIASLHVYIDSSQGSYIETAKVIRSIFHKYGIHSATVQPEFVGSPGVSDDSYRNFARIAGGGLTASTSDNDHENNIVPDNSRAQPFAYGATTSQTGCLVDDAVNCNSDSCLPK